MSFLKALYNNGPVKILLGVIVIYCIFVYVVPAMCEDADNAACDVANAIADVFSIFDDIMLAAMIGVGIFAGVGVIKALLVARAKRSARVDKRKKQPPGTDAKRWKDNYYDDDGKAKGKTKLGNDPRTNTFENLQKTASKDSKKGQGKGKGRGKGKTVKMGGRR